MRLLDLYSGAGGAAMGYFRAGFEVVGVDVKPQPRYPFAFVQADALDYLAQHGRDFDAIHASPPCQHYSALHSFRPGEYPDLVPATREALMAIGQPWVIENVVGSPMRSGVTLCGSAFGLGAHCRDGAWHQLRRHRYFESNVFMLGPPCVHRGRPVGVYGNGGGTRGLSNEPGITGFTGNTSERREAMGIDWMNRYEISQAIPPAYTEWIGRRLVEGRASCG